MFENPFFNINHLQLENFCLQRTMLCHNVKICEMFSVDLSFLTMLFSEIIMFSIVLIQIKYIDDINYFMNYN